MTLAIRTPSVVPRRSAPFPLVVTLANRERALHQGQLRLAVINEGFVQYLWTSDEWVVAGEGRTATVLLPPLPVRPFGDGFEVKPVWIENGREIDLGQRTVTAADHGGRSLLLGLCLPPTTLRGQNLQLALSLEHYAAKPFNLEGNVDEADARAMNGGELGLHTVPVRLRAEDLPEQALAWCAYDMVVVAGDSLAALKLRQVQALESWVRGGGSALMLLDGPVAPAVGEFLHRSAATAGRPAWFAVDSQGRVDLGVIADQQARLRVGLGRLVVAPLAVADRDDAGLRTSVAFLWKLRSERAVKLAAGGDWSSTATAPGSMNSFARSPSSMSMPANRLLVDSVDLRGRLIELLWPDQVAVIPFSVIVCIFLVFVLAVGPGDWFLLGWLKARRFTWLLFPALAIACTWFTVWISRRYLGADDLVQRLEIVDVDSIGATLRHDRIVLDFTGESRSLTAAGKESLWASLGSVEPSRRRFRQQAGYQQGEDEDAAGVALRFTGTFPTAYQVQRYVPQWTPTLSRELSFADCPLPWTPDFSGIADLEQLRAHAEALRGQAGGGVVVAYQHGQQALLLGDPGDLMDRRVTDQARRQAQSGIDDRHWLRALCLRPAEGWFAIASQVSPMGGASIEDCAISDRDDQSLLVVVAKRRGDTVWMVRRSLQVGAP